MNRYTWQPRQRSKTTLRNAAISARAKNETARSRAQGVAQDAGRRDDHAHALREPRWRLGLGTRRRPQPGPDQPPVQEAVRRVPQPGERTDGEHHELRGEQPDTAGD